jgi:hypothetical protein
MAWSRASTCGAAQLEARIVEVRRAHFSARDRVQLAAARVARRHQRRVDVLRLDAHVDDGHQPRGARGDVTVLHFLADAFDVLALQHPNVLRLCAEHGHRQVHAGVRVHHVMFVLAAQRHGFVDLVGGVLSHHQIDDDIVLLLAAPPGSCRVRQVIPQHIFIHDVREANAADAATSALRDFSEDFLDLSLGQVPVEPLLHKIVEPFAVHDVSSVRLVLLADV